MNIIKIPYFPFSNLFTKEYKTDSNNPNKPVKNKLCFGNYCMRATVHRQDEDYHNVYSYYGYSNDLSILDETQNVCNKRRKENETCLTPTLMFLQDVPNCNNLITEVKNSDNSIKIVKYGKK